MGTYVVKQENYDSERDTVLGIPRSKYLANLEEKIRVLLNSTDVEKVYTDLPENIQDWFDAEGVIEVKLRNGVDADDFNLQSDINSMMWEIANEDGMLVIVTDSETWDRSCLIYPEDEAYADYRRLK